MDKSPTPCLYHASPNLPAGAVELKPHHNRTCVWSDYKGMPEQSNHEGDFVFAGRGIKAAYAYALKLEHPNLVEHYEHGDRNYQFMANVSVLTPTLPDGGKAEPVIAAVISKPGEFMQALKAAKPTIYRIPEQSPGHSYQFEEVRWKNGTPSGEFISRKPVPLAECAAIPVQDVAQVMREGVQILFLNEAVTKAQWFAISNEGQKVIEASLPEQVKQDAALNDTIRTQAAMAFYERLIENGILTHANRECGLKPYDFGAGKYMAPEKAASSVSGTWQQQALRGILLKEMTGQASARA